MGLPLPRPSSKSPLSAPPSTIRSVAFTGASSFLGQNLIGLLEEDARVERIVALDIASPATAGSKTVLYDIDLTRPGSDSQMGEILARERVEVLVHLAFLANPTHAEGWAHELEAVGTMQTFTAARQANIRSVILWSQSMLYGALPTNPNFLTERHPLRARTRERFFADKIEAEAEATRFAEQTGAAVTVLRTAAILGPTIRNPITHYLSQRLVPTLMGFDPLWQFVHEVDAVAAFRLAIDRRLAGTFNIVGDGVLPLSTAIHLAGRTATPIPHTLANMASAGMWFAKQGAFPPSFLDYLRYLCVADGDHAARVLGFRPAYTTREAILDFANAQRLRDVRLLHDVVHSNQT